jgi:hypothetical protein
MKHADMAARFLSSPLMRRLPWALLALPILQGFWFVHCYGVNAVWQDQWNGIAPLFEKWFAGTLGFADFWAQHNEHRVIVPRLLMFALGLLTRWNTVAEMYATQVVLTFLAMILVGMFLRDCKASNRLWLMLPIALLAFSLRQIENMLWGWQLGFVLVAALAVASLACLSLLNRSERRTLKCGGALLFAAGATFSSAQGLSVWPVGLVPLLLAPLERKTKTVLIAGWTVAAAIACAAYFHDYARPYQQPSLAFSFQYFATIIGSSLFHVVDVATLAGAIVLLLIAAVAVLVYKEDQWGRHSFWLAVLVYGLLIQLQITVGRSLYGVEQAISSRYTTCSLLIIIGVYAILSNLSNSGGKSLGRLIHGLWALFLAMITAGLVVFTVTGYQLGLKAWENVDYHAFMMVTSASQPDVVFDFSPDVRPRLVRRMISCLKEHQWNIFASSEIEARYAIAKANLPELSSPAQVKLIRFGADDESRGTIEVHGWAVDSAAKDLVGGVFLEIDGVLYPTYYGCPCKEILTLFDNRSLVRCGFQRLFPDTLLSLGRHRIDVKVLTKDRTAFFKTSISSYLDVTE